MTDQLGEIGFYTLAGHANSPRDLIDEARVAEELGLGSGFVSERFNVKDACTLSGALGAVTEVPAGQRCEPQFRAAAGCTGRCQPAKTSDRRARSTFRIQ